MLMTALIIAFCGCESSAVEIGGRWSNPSHHPERIVRVAGIRKFGQMEKRFLLVGPKYVFSGCSRNENCWGCLTT